MALWRMLGEHNRVILVDVLCYKFFLYDVCVCFVFNDV